MYITLAGWYVCILRNTTYQTASQVLWLIFFKNDEEHVGIKQTGSQKKNSYIKPAA